MSHQEHLHKNAAVKVVEKVIFNIKWILPLFYLGLVVVLFAYGYVYAIDTFEFIFKAGHPRMEDLKVSALESIDVVMIANLIKMIITGSYNSFISKDHGSKGDNISSGMLKIKIATSVDVIILINLLRTFLDYEVNMDMLIQKTIIFGCALVGTIVLGIMEYLHIKGEQIEHSLHH